METSRRIIDYHLKEHIEWRNSKITLSGRKQRANRPDIIMGSSGPLKGENILPDPIPQTRVGRGIFYFQTVNFWVRKRPQR
jgi:hypothetical protein